MYICIFVYYTQLVTIKDTVFPQLMHSNSKCFTLWNRYSTYLFFAPIVQIPSKFIIFTQLGNGISWERSECTVYTTNCKTADVLFANTFWYSYLSVKLFIRNQCYDKLSTTIIFCLWFSSSAERSNKFD